MFFSGYSYSYDIEKTMYCCELSIYCNYLVPDIWRVLKKASYCPIFLIKNSADCSILWASLDTLIITMLGWKYACTKTKIQQHTYNSTEILCFITIIKLLLSFSSLFSLFIPLNTDKIYR